MHAEASVTIEAPIERVWAVMLDFGAYPTWNPFVVRVEGVVGTPIVGQRMRLHVRWADGTGTTSDEEFVEIEGPAGGKARLVYAFRGALHTFGMVRGSRIQSLETVGAGTRYASVEDFSGLLRGFVPLAKVQDGFERHAKALKAQVEADAATR